MLHDFKPSDDGLDKAQRKAEIDRLREKLAAQQQSVMAAKLPVVVLVEGWDCAGKGHLINELISEMDPRFYRVAVYKRVPENEERYPFLRKFFEPLPENGKFLFMDTGWMEDCVYKYLRREITAEEYERRVDACNIFERQLRDNGYIVVKLFLHISREEQLSRIAELRENIDTEWRVTGDDLWQHKGSTRPSAVPTASLWRKRPSAANGTFSTPGIGKSACSRAFAPSRRRSTTVWKMAAVSARQGRTISRCSAHFAPRRRSHKERCPGGIQGRAQAPAGKSSRRSIIRSTASASPSSSAMRAGTPPERAATSAVWRIRSTRAGLT